MRFIIIFIGEFISTFVIAFISMILGYFLFISILTPLWFLLEIGGIQLPFHGVDNTLLIPWKWIIFISGILSVVVALKGSKDNFEIAETEKEIEDTNRGENCPFCGSHNIQNPGTYGRSICCDCGRWF